MNEWLEVEDCIHVVPFLLMLATGKVSDDYVLLCECTMVV